MKVGVLALQGDFDAHARALARAGAEALLVRTSADFAGIDALVLPGGESTAMLHGLARDGVEPALRAFVASGRALLGTCAGAILLARELRGSAQRSLGALDIAVERNAYGTQADSFVCKAETDDPDSELSGLECVLIRAPRIVRVGAGVTVHARIHSEPALVSCGPVWAATFHPELTDDTCVQRAWLRSAASPA
ncbi:MAG: pyridoxal 5'-phosphate synthase glutaminase subunit PdxT [Myxococcota bacterium]